MCPGSGLNHWEMKYHKPEELFLDIVSNPLPCGVFTFLIDFMVSLSHNEWHTFFFSSSIVCEISSSLETPSLSFYLLGLCSMNCNKPFPPFLLLCILTHILIKSGFQKEDSKMETVLKVIYSRDCLTRYLQEWKWCKVNVKKRAQQRCCHKKSLS